MLQNKLFKKEKGKWFIIYEMEKADNKKYIQYDSIFASCGFFPHIFQNVCNKQILLL